MSVNNLLDSEILIPIMMVMFVIIIVVAIPLGKAMKKKTDNNIYGDDEYGATEEEKNAKLIVRRSIPHPLYHQAGMVVNIAVFELSNGSRIELAIKDPNIYGTMVEGDCGTLRYKGKKFISFERR